MPEGPGKYDDACTLVRELTGGKAVMVCVIGGDRGSGYSAQVASREEPPEEMARAMITVLRAVADAIEADLKG